MVLVNTLGERPDTDWIVSNSFLLLQLLYYFTKGMYSSKDSLTIEIHDRQNKRKTHNTSQWLFNITFFE